MKPVPIRVHQKQLEFLRSKAPTVAFQGGAGSGKTFAGVLWSLLRAQQAGSRGMIVAATYPMLQQSILVHLRELTRRLQWDTAWEWNKQQNIIALPWLRDKSGRASEIYLRSADKPESLLGADLAWLYGDEVALWKHDAYRYLMGRLRQPGFKHQAAFTFTPKGRNWAWEELGQPREGLHIIQVRTTDNPFLSPDYLERLRREYGEGTAFWRQEVLGEFVAFEGLVYPMFDPHVHVRQPPEDGLVRVVAGVDWGHANPSVILVVGMDGDGALWVCDEFYQALYPWERLPEVARELAERWRIETFYCDPSGAGLIDLFQRHGLRARPADNAVLPGISAIAARLTANELFIAPHCRNTLREIAAYSWRQQRDGTVRQDEPAKVDDHAMDALRYAVMGLVGKPRAVFAQII